MKEAERIYPEDPIDPEYSKKFKVKIMEGKKDSNGRLVMVNLFAPGFSSGRDVYFHFSRNKSECNAFRKGIVGKMKVALEAEMEEAEKENKERYGDYE